MKTSKGIEAAYKNIVGPKLANVPSSKGSGGNAGPAAEVGKMHKGLDSLFSYQGVKYQDLPSYKDGGGGGKSLDRLAQMMGGQIYNPYQYSRMTSSGSSSGKFPYESTLSSQEAASQAALQKLRGEQESGLQKLRGEQEMGLQSARFKEERESQKMTQLANLESQLRGMKYGTPEYFELKMMISDLRR
jgi:hypothetical protein